MARSTLEVADIFRSFGDTYRRRFHPSEESRRVMWAIEHCRTAALGGHLYVCDRCGKKQPRYNSCRNRHCPKCQSLASAAWLEARQHELLPVGYFHVVFTVPSLLRAFFVRNPRRLYNLLFTTAWEALRSVAANERHLGARIGALALLHSWSQTLSLHPHIHCIVPGGGMTADGKQWVHCASDFLVPVKVLSARFRSVFLKGLSTAYRTGKLDLGGQLEPFRHPVRFEDLVAELSATPWVVFSKAPFGEPSAVLRYLARYTHRVAISNERIVAIENGRVTFAYKDYRQDGMRRVMSLEATEFIRRFLLHVLPPRLVRIRYYGLLANRNRAKTIEQVRPMLETESASAAPDIDTGEVESWDCQLLRLTGTDPCLCPACGLGHLHLVHMIPVSPRQRAPP